MANNNLIKQSSALMFMALMASAIDLPIDCELCQPITDTYIEHHHSDDRQLYNLKYSLLGCSEQAQKIYDDALKKEPAITRDMIDIRNKLDIDFYGLGNTIKQAESVVSKLNRLAAQDKAEGIIKQDYEYMAMLGDLVRYTFMCQHDVLAGITKEIIKELTDKGYCITELDNKYLRNELAYKAIHINATAPNKQKIELQIHSPESMYLNVFTHELYEKARNLDDTNPDKPLLKEKIRLAYASLSIPADIETIQNIHLEEQIS